MKQIFVFGASVTYGVGGTDGGWVDKCKLALCKMQYTPDSGERYELYNFARPGMIISEVLECMDSDIKHRKHADSEVTLIISVGLNNSKCIGGPKNFVSTPESFRRELEELIEKAKKVTSKVIFVGFTPVDKKREKGIASPLTGEATYFFNNRILEFDKICRDVCRSQGVEHVALFEAASDLNWSEYLSPDGLHPGSQGHAWIFERVWPIIEKNLQSSK